jgi:SAM-dependent methyltransferase
MTPSAPSNNSFRRWSVIAKCIVHNWLTAIRLSFGNRASAIGATHTHLTLSQSIGYIGKVYEDYIRWGQLAETDLAGARILEIGPGDNAGIALRFIAAGARQVVCLDKFESYRNPDTQLKIYRALRDELPPAGQQRYDRAIRLTSSFEIDAEQVRVISNCGIERAHEFLEPGSFDLIVSRAVLEEVFEIEQAFAAMDRLLRPGGRLIHKIDLSDYGLFSGKGFNALEFLTIPSPLYWLMSKYSGIPNRKRIGFYSDLMKRYGYDAQYLTTALAGIGELPEPSPKVNPELLPPSVLDGLRTVRPRLAGCFRSMPDADLLCSGIFLVARKGAAEDAGIAPTTASA